MFNSRNVVFHICRVVFVILIIKSAMAKVITDITVHSHPNRVVAVRSQVWNMWLLSARMTICLFFQPFLCWCSWFFSHHSGTFSQCGPTLLLSVKSSLLQWEKSCKNSKEPALFWISIVIKISSKKGSLKTVWEQTLKHSSHFVASACWIYVKKGKKNEAVKENFCIFNRSS